MGNGKWEERAYVQISDQQLRDDRGKPKYGQHRTEPRGVASRRTVRPVVDAV